ncbi:MAG: hypothetical protein ACRC1T_09185 [Clostridium chrysemydis]|uniref:hypothetical protein n=1 Tax=Clostridium chrysemydis TaxID=2665504 RepID=UPI003F418235
MEIVNRTGGQLRISMLGKNLTDKEVDIYQISINTGESLSFSADPLSSGNYDMITVKGRDGSIVGQVQGDEQDPNGEVAFSFYEDFAYLGKEHVYGNSKNRLLNLLNGETFVNKGHKIVPIGTNGTDKTKTARAKFNEMNKPYKYIFYNEGEFIKENGTADATTGKVTLKKNPYKSSFDMFNKTFCFEVMTTSSGGQVNRIFPILAKATAEWAEGDINQFNCTANRGCDMWEKDDFLTEVHPIDSSEAQTYMENYNELYVDFIVVNGGSEPTASENNGKLLLDITAEGVPTIKKSDGSTWEEEATLKKLVKIGTRFKSKRVENGEGIDCNVFAVIGEDGAKCVDFTTDNRKRFFCKVKDFDLKISLDYVDYITE